MNKNWNDRADKDLFFTILSVKNIGVISGSEWTTIGNHMRTLGYGFTNEGCRQHFQGLRRAQHKSETNGGSPDNPRKVDPTTNPITRRPGPGRGRPKKQPQQAAQMAIAVLSEQNGEASQPSQLSQIGPDQEVQAGQPQPVIQPDLQTDITDLQSSLHQSDFQPSPQPDLQHNHQPDLQHNHQSDLQHTHQPDLPHDLPHDLQHDPQPEHQPTHEESIQDDHTHLEASILPDSLMSESLDLPLKDDALDLSLKDDNDDEQDGPDAKRIKLDNPAHDHDHSLVDDEAVLALAAHSEPPSDGYNSEYPTAGLTGSDPHTSFFGPET
ncbi:putative accumulation-associated protein [Colletotrichum scovillei]|uniref:Accumulation-associated protein n=1 Tax=Colletotrichum scovillei TaxID=1209932 RepID=A0A9P7UKL7_9PEZI|nr:putative accumulation-associated protein [Colletotrichum scovillei]KAG7072367.1 putative accumulation-associated protein [Colletotrichum scovillei]KAG7080623.1 putative accumulation-associated protein [Colletotrichum scovillei]